MQTRPLALVMTITMLGAAPLAAADEAPKSYAVDGGASEVVYHLVHKLHKVDGRTHRVDGRAALTPDGRAQVELRLPPDSFDSGNVNRDAHMKEVLEVAKYPTLELKALVAKILRQHQHHADVPSEPTPAPAPGSPMKSERKEALRKAQARIINAHCYETGADYAVLNNELNKAVGVRRIRDCDEQQLLKRYQLAKEWCSERPTS